jgi:hypothetical protein
LNKIYYDNVLLQSEKLNSEFDFCLPISKCDYAAKSTDTNINEFLDDSFENLVFNAGSSIENKIVSNFAALSGLHDKHSDFHFKDKSWLIHLKSKFFSFKDLMPTIEVGKNVSDFYGNEIKLNSFFVDFFNHGIYASILNENKIREEDAFDYLKDFKMILSFLTMILSNGHYSPFLNEINKISDKFDELFSKADFDMRKKF